MTPHTPRRRFCAAELTTTTTARSQFGGFDGARLVDGFVGVGATVDALAAATGRGELPGTLKVRSAARTSRVSRAAREIELYTSLASPHEIGNGTGKLKA